MFGLTKPQKCEECGSITYVPVRRSNNHPCNNCKVILNPIGLIVELKPEVPPLCK